MARSRSSERTPIDWAEIRRRVDLAAQAVTGSGGLSPERSRSVLEDRARSLARVVEPGPSGDTLDLVTFRLATERYAIDSRSVFGVFRLTDFCRLPGARPPVSGVTVWRGELLTVLDLRPLLGLSHTTLDDLSRVIVLGDQRAEIGVLADSVLELTTVGASSLHAPADDRRWPHQCIRGVTTDALQVLDGSRILQLGSSTT